MVRWKLFLWLVFIYAISFTMVYLTWVGAQYLCFHSVTMQATDITVAGILSAFIAREAVIIINTLYMVKQQQQNKRKAG